MREGILGRLSGNDCAAVTEAQLAGISGSLALRGKSIAALQSGDFTGLTALTFLHLADNQLAVLADGLFVGLTALTGLYLSGNPGAPFALPLGIEQVLESGGVYTLRVDFARRGRGRIIAERARP